MKTLTNDQHTFTDIISFLKKQEIEAKTGNFSLFVPYTFYEIDELLAEHKWYDIPVMAAANEIIFSGADCLRWIKYCQSRFNPVTWRRLKESYNDFMNRVCSEADDFPAFLNELGVLDSDLYPREWAFQNQLIYKELGRSSFSSSGTIQNDQWWLSRYGADFLNLAFQLYNSYGKALFANKQQPLNPNYDNLN